LLGFISFSWISKLFFLSKKVKYFSKYCIGMKFLGSSKLYGKNQITVPKEVVTILQVEQGQQILFLQDEQGNVFLTKEVTLPSKKG